MLQLLMCQDELIFLFMSFLFPSFFLSFSHSSFSYLFSFALFFIFPFSFPFIFFSLFLSFSFHFFVMLFCKLDVFWHFISNKNKTLNIFLKIPSYYFLTCCIGIEGSGRNTVFNKNIPLQYLLFTALYYKRRKKWWFDRIKEQTPVIWG